MSDRKISEALLDFVNPMLDDSVEYTEKELTALCSMASLIWNAVILDASQEGTDLLDQVRERLMSFPEGIAIFRLLLERKRSKPFCDDRRLIGELEFVEGEDGEIRLRASAHEPPMPS